MYYISNIICKLINYIFGISVQVIFFSKELFTPKTSHYYDVISTDYFDSNKTQFLIHTCYHYYL